MARIKLQLKGFDDMLEQIQKAGGDVNQAADTCIRESAGIMHDELKAAAQSTGMDGGLVSRMPQPEIKVNGNRYEAKVGYKMDNYNPDDPSDGFKAAFWNYGTPRRQTSEDKQRVMINGRWVTMERSRGEIPAHGYIANAKKAAAPKIKKAQRNTLKDILGRLSG